MENHGSHQNHHSDPMALLAEMRKEMEVMKRKSDENLNVLRVENERLRQKVEGVEKERSRRAGSTEQQAHEEKAEVRNRGVQLLAIPLGGIHSPRTSWRSNFLLTGKVLHWTDMTDRLTRTSILTFTLPRLGSSHQMIISFVRSFLLP